MELTPLYELRERLKAGAIAGAELAGEDFRLKRAVEAFAPLEGASPVFGKIGQMAKTVIAPECPDRAGALLDALTLMDAVICTQGAVAVAGEIDPIIAIPWGTAVTNAPYSLLSVLLDALTNTGSGRYSYILEMHEQKPELFRDYRVMEAMVRALGASYAELAQQVAEWLKEESPVILPLLENGFDPKGKKEMVRRVRVIEAVAGKDANAFYLSQLETATKEVRQALIYALRHSEENAEKLMELARTEKGNAKNMAFYALAQLEGEKVWEFLQEECSKKLSETIPFLCLAHAEPSYKLVGEALIEQLRPLVNKEKEKPCTKEQMVMISKLLNVLPGKSGPEICECYRMAASLGKTLDREWNIEVPIKTVSYQVTLTISEAIPAVLEYSLICRPTKELEDLAYELYDTYGNRYFAPAVTAKLLSSSASECYEWVDGLLEKKSLQEKVMGSQEKKLEKALSSVQWNESLGQYVQHAYRYNPGEERLKDIFQPLKEPLDERFFDLLMQCKKTEMDTILSHWIQPQNRPLCEKLGKYYYEKALTDKQQANDRRYLGYMKLCGWKDCSGLAMHYCRGNHISIWQLLYYVGELPGDNQTKAIEAQKVADAIEKGDIKIQGDITKLQKYILDLKIAEPLN